MSEGVMPMGALQAPVGEKVHVVRLRPAAQHSVRQTWLLFPAVFLIAAIATFFISQIRTTPAVPRTSPISPLPDPQSAPLELRVETQGAELRLSWNPANPAIGAARGGLLVIDDGGRHRQIPLDHDQIVGGSIIYRPASNDVSFHLNIRCSNGPDIAQVLRVLYASPRPSALEAAVPASEPVKTMHRATTIGSHPAFKSRLPAQAPRPTVRVAQTTPSSVPVAAIPPPVTVAQSAQSASVQPLPDGGAALRKPASAQLQQPISAPKPAEVPKASSQSNTSTSSIPTAAPAKQLPIPAYVPPRPTKWVQPDQHLPGVSSSLLPVDIRVKVKIDETGHVTAAHPLIDGGKRDKKLMAAAAAAVRQWTFEPAKAHGINVPTEEIIVIHLGPEAQ